MMFWYGLHWLRREWKARRNPLNRLIYDHVLDGERRRVEPVAFKPPYPRGAQPRKTLPHCGPLRTIDGETFCVRCGVGVDQDGFYERAVTNEGARLLPVDVARHSNHFDETELAARLAARIAKGHGRG